MVFAFFFIVIHLCLCFYSRIVGGNIVVLVLAELLVFTSAMRPRADVAYCIHALARRLAKTHNWTVWTMECDIVTKSCTWVPFRGFNLSMECIFIDVLILMRPYFMIVAPIIWLLECKMELFMLNLVLLQFVPLLTPLLHHAPMAI